MPRRPALHPKVRIHVTLPAELHGRIVLACHSIKSPTDSGGIGLGALSAFFEEAAKRQLEAMRIAAQRAEVEPMA